MAKNIKINGASFSDVPAILVSLASGSGNAKFIEESEIQGGGVNVETLTVKPSSASTTFTISGLKGQPKAFVLQYNANLTTTSTRYVVAASSNGSQHQVTYAYKSGNNGYVYQSTSYLTVTYSNGTLTLKTSSTTSGGTFYNGNYRLVYVY